MIAVGIRCHVYRVTRAGQDSKRAYDGHPPRACALAALRDSRKVSIVGDNYCCSTLIGHPPQEQVFLTGQPCQRNRSGVGGIAGKFRCRGHRYGIGDGKPPTAHGAGIAGGDVIKGRRYCAAEVQLID